MEKRFHLSDAEQRVLGVLIEKALSQPTYYPMTVNSITAACNQKNNRDPIVTYDESEVYDTLQQLQQAGLVTRIMPSGASRVDKFRHDADSHYGWDKAQMAIMTELLVRGPQTPGELRSRCERMYPFASIEVMTNVLDSLASMTPPMVRVLPRAQGQAALRFTHTLHDGAGVTQDEEAWQAPIAAQPYANKEVTAKNTVHDDVRALRAHVDELFDMVRGLQDRLDRLER